MIIVDNALEAREAQGKPIRVGMIGAGLMGRGLVKQVVHSVPGERMVAIFNRHVQNAINCYKYAGLDAVVADTQSHIPTSTRAINDPSSDLSPAIAGLLSFAACRASFPCSIQWPRQLHHNSLRLRRHDDDGPPIVCTQDGYSAPHPPRMRRAWPGWALIAWCRSGESRSSAFP